ncbi:hypothetical protein NEUTE1DRAFT_118122 [Neurospora tetrasperma FGSC 2508]|uniref:Uncharacterized protein n=1 Tax=Neurospora tetrasperma (strain FGSC 2508 / ATCC MYA-4615 / P0657) TaxID=510951 RepID=F8MX07_NEUT8|nr:uncharacterized protein NEUTE1DRAFT_118122 [Neurospora tetrasperma FGSC 2508]EGO54278.1 hypothetical protein NEUTE1DRAFT_118122 [Neurospora tetrasperma FGSC 2508]EGZ68286.1 hypothetical protein NEUTE2DRAFT_145911 [Neurospora tetrasperma FGSC 2509]
MINQAFTLQVLSPKGLCRSHVSRPAGSRCSYERVLAMGSMCYPVLSMYDGTRY